MDESEEHHEQLEKSKVDVDNPESEDDLISSLPHNVLCHILSFLPTKNAVGTSILSSKWKDLFALVPNLSLDFDDSLLLHPNPLEEDEKDSADDTESKKVRKSGFIAFVGGVLKRLQQSNASVCEFKLKSQQMYTDDCIVSWLRGAVLLGVQRVCLNVSIRDFGKVINTLNGCTSLVKLFLFKSSVLNVPLIEFPSLKTLALHYIILSDDESTSLLFDGCPALEELLLINCFTNSDRFCIKARRLKKLFIMNCLISRTSTIVIDTPELEFLLYVGVLGASFEFLTKLDHILDLVVHIVPFEKCLEEDDGQSIYDSLKLAELINPCSGVESLTLGVFAVEALYHLYVQFCNLRSLQLEAMGMSGWKTLGYLLENASNLEELHIQGFNMNDGDFTSFFSSLNGVPYCLSSSLKTIKIGGFKGHEDEIRLMKYFLRNGKVMEKLSVKCDFEGDENSRVIKRMLEAECRSETCKIVWR